VVEREGFLDTATSFGFYLGDCGRCGFRIRKSLDRVALLFKRLALYPFVIVTRP
jgi:hypothetical protein